MMNLKKEFTVYIYLVQIYIHKNPIKNINNKRTKDEI